MINVWIKRATDGTTIIFRKEGSRDAGFVYSAEGRTVTEVSSRQEELTPEEVEILFADYVKGTKPDTSCQG